MTFDMICTCRISGFLPTEERRLRIFNRVRLDEHEDLTTTIVLSLAFDFCADVDIDADMWFGVSLSTPLLDEPLYIECDHPEDGLEFLWEHLADRFPERVSVRESRKERSEPLATLISAGLVEQYKIFEGRWRDVSRHHDVRGDAPSDVYYADLHLYVLAGKTIRNMWGGNVLDAAIEKAFGG